MRTIIIGNSLGEYRLQRPCAPAGQRSARGVSPGLHWRPGRLRSSVRLRRAGPFSRGDTKDNASLTLPISGRARGVASLRARARFLARPPACFHLARAPGSRAGRTKPRPMPAWHRPQSRPPRSSLSAAEPPATERQHRVSGLLPRSTSHSPRTEAAARYNPLPMRSPPGPESALVSRADVTRGTLKAPDDSARCVRVVRCRALRIVAILDD